MNRLPYGSQNVFFFSVFISIHGRCQFLIVVMHFADQTGFRPTLDFIGCFVSTVGAFAAPSLHLRLDAGNSK